MVMLKICYFNGFAGSPNPLGEKVSLLKDFGEVFPVDTEGAYSVPAYQKAFHETLEKNDIRLSDPLVFFGTSLGGFWARTLGYAYSVPWIALNPSLSPSEELLQFTGKNTVFDTGQRFTWTKQECSVYLPIENSVKDYLEIPGLIIVAKDDDVLTTKGLAEASKKCAFVQVESGGHRLLNTRGYQDYIKEFLDNLLI